VGLGGGFNSPTGYQNVGLVGQNYRFCPFGLRVLELGAEATLNAFPTNRPVYVPLSRLALGATLQSLCSYYLISTSLLCLLLLLL